MRALSTSLLSACLAFSVGGAAPDQAVSETASQSLEELAAARRTRPLTALSPVEHQIFIYERETLRALRTGGVDLMMDLFIGENAIVCPPGVETIQGRDQQKVAFKSWLGMEGVELDYEPIDVYVGPSGDMAFAHGLVRWKNPGEPRYLGKYVSVWAKEGGRWMNQAEMRNVIVAEGDGK